MVRLPVTCFLLMLYHIKAQKNKRINLGWYHPDYSPFEEKRRLIEMAKELVNDVNKKVFMLDHIRHKMEEDHTFLFHVGTTLGAIREQYKTQLEIYRQMRDRFVGRNRVNVPEYQSCFAGMHFVIAMEEIYGKEVLIENQLLAILRIPEEEFEYQEPNSPPNGILIDVGNNGHVPQFEDNEGDGPDYEDYEPHPDASPAPGMYLDPRRTKKKNLRSGYNPAGKVTKSMKMTEEELKKSLRAQYYERHKKF